MSDFRLLEKPERMPLPELNKRLMKAMTKATFATEHEDEARIQEAARATLAKYGWTRRGYLDACQQRREKCAKLESEIIKRPLRSGA